MESKLLRGGEEAVAVVEETVEWGRGGRRGRVGGEVVERVGEQEGVAAEGGEDGEVGGRFWVERKECHWWRRGGLFS